MATKRSTLSAKVIAFSNEKGGVGKSTISTTLAYLLAKRGNKVCVIDYDGQANASMILGLSNVNQVPISIATLMRKIIQDEPLPPPESYIHTMPNGVDLIPSNAELFTLERELQNADFREEILVQLVDQLRPLYEYILLDTMPQLGTALINVFLCADSVIIPTQSELLSAKGLSELLRHIKKMQRTKACHLKIEGVLINMDSSTTNNSKVVSEFLSKSYDSDIKLFKTRIPRSIKVAEASIYQQTICEYDPIHPVSLAYENLLKELLENVKKQTA